MSQFTDINILHDISEAIFESFFGDFFKRREAASLLRTTKAIKAKADSLQEAINSVNRAYPTDNEGDRSDDQAEAWLPAFQANIAVQNSSKPFIHTELHPCFTPIGGRTLGVAVDPLIAESLGGLEGDHRGDEQLGRILTRMVALNRTTLDQVLTDIQTAKDSTQSQGSDGGYMIPASAAGEWLARTTTLQSSAQKLMDVLESGEGYEDTIASASGDLERSLYSEFLLLNVSHRAIMARMQRAAADLPGTTNTEDAN